MIGNFVGNRDLEFFLPNGLWNSMTKIWRKNTHAKKVSSSFTFSLNIFLLFSLFEVKLVSAPQRTKWRLKFELTNLNLAAVMFGRLARC